MAIVRVGSDGSCGLPQAVRTSAATEAAQQAWRVGLDGIIEVTLEADLRRVRRVGVSREKPSR